MMSVCPMNRRIYRTKGDKNQNADWNRNELTYKIRIANPGSVGSPMEDLMWNPKMDTSLVNIWDDHHMIITWPPLFQSWWGESISHFQKDVDGSHSTLRAKMEPQKWPCAMLNSMGHIGKLCLKKKHISCKNIICYNSGIASWREQQFTVRI